MSKRTGAAGDDHVAIAKIHGILLLWILFVGILGEVTALLIQAEALLAHKAAEIGAGRLGVLAGLVLRPAVEACLSPALGIALAPIGPQRRAPAIVGLDLADHVALAVAVLDHGRRQRHPRRDLARLLGPADAQS